ncbi:MAG: hypothetical protein A2Y38_17125 [Spirochaetes bacterium GWB1_59_5]|nr:MAG: hypothetical protein A2Y38_17125 [Spirochaetes bacterium GWB1_59_5]
MTMLSPPLTIQLIRTAIAAVPDLQKVQVLPAKAFCTQLHYIRFTSKLLVEDGETQPIEPTSHSDKVIELALVGHRIKLGTVPNYSEDLIVGLLAKPLGEHMLAKAHQELNEMRTELTKDIVVGVYREMHISAVESEPADHFQVSANVLIGSACYR